MTLMYYLNSYKTWITPAYFPVPCQGTINNVGQPPSGRCHDNLNHTYIILNFVSRFFHVLALLFWVYVCLYCLLIVHAALHVYRCHVIWNLNLGHKAALELASTLAGRRTLNSLIITRRCVLCSLVYNYGPVSRANAHIGSICACSGGQSRFGLALVDGLGQSKEGQPPQTNHTTVLRCRHCDGEVVIHSTNGHLVLITRLLSLSKIRTPLRTFYTMRYIDDAKGWL